MRLDPVPSRTCAELNAHVTATGVRDEAGVSYPGWWGVTTYQVLVNGLPLADFSAEGITSQLTSLPGDQLCFRASRIGITFSAETEMTRIDWVPMPGCARVWRERAETVERHEEKHVRLIDAAVAAANRRWAQQTFTACSANGVMAEVEAGLVRKIARGIAAAHKRLVTRIVAERRALDRLESAGPLDCRECALTISYRAEFRNETAGGGANFPMGWVDFSGRHAFRLHSEVRVRQTEPGVYTGDGPVEWDPGAEVLAHESGWVFYPADEVRCDYVRDIEAVRFHSGTATARLTLVLGAAGPPGFALDFSLGDIREDVVDRQVTTAGPCPGHDLTRTGHNAARAYAWAHTADNGGTARIDKWQPGGGEVVAVSTLAIGVPGQELGTCEERWEITEPV